jgi:hypothetical protein
MIPKAPVQGSSSEADINAWWTEMNAFRRQNPTEFSEWESSNPAMAVRWNARAANKSQTYDDGFSRKAAKARAKELAYGMTQELGYGTDGVNNGKTVVSDFNTVNDVSSNWGAGDFWKVGTEQSFTTGLDNLVQDDPMMVAGIAAALLMPQLAPALAGALGVSNAVAAGIITGGIEAARGGDVKDILTAGVSAWGLGAAGAVDPKTGTSMLGTASEWVDKNILSAIPNEVLTPISDGLDALGSVAGQGKAAIDKALTNVLGVEGTAQVMQFAGQAGSGAATGAITGNSPGLLGAYNDLNNATNQSYNMGAEEGGSPVVPPAQEQSMTNPMQPAVQPEQTVYEPKQSNGLIFGGIPTPPAPQEEQAMPSELNSDGNVYGGPNAAAEFMGVGDEFKKPDGSWDFKAASKAAGEATKKAQGGTGLIFGGGPMGSSNPPELQPQQPEQTEPEQGQPSQAMILAYLASQGYNPPNGGDSSLIPANQQQGNQALWDVPGMNASTTQARPDYGPVDYGPELQGPTETGGGLIRPSAIPASNAGQPSWAKYQQNYADPNYGGGKAFNEYTQIAEAMRQQGLLGQEDERGLI